MPLRSQRKHQNQIVWAEVKQVTWGHQMLVWGFLLNFQLPLADHSPESQPAKAAHLQPWLPSVTLLNRSHLHTSIYTNFERSIRRESADFCLIDQFQDQSKLQARTAIKLICLDVQVNVLWGTLPAPHFLSIKVVGLLWWMVNPPLDAPHHSSVWHITSLQKVAYH